MEPKTILIVDDEPDVISYIEMILQDKRYRVFAARNGKMGLEMALKLKPDLVLLDVLMPVVQGTEALRYIRSLPELEKTRVVLMSSLPPKEFDMVSPVRAQADEYLLKPASTSLILRTIEKALSVSAE